MTSENINNTPIARFHSRAIELIKSKHNDSQYSKLNIIQKLDYILFDLAKIAQELYYADPHSNTSENHDFRMIMNAITNTNANYIRNRYINEYYPNVLACQKGYSHDDKGNFIGFIYESKFIPKVTSESINEAFDYYNKVINMIHNVLV